MFGSIPGLWNSQPVVLMLQGVAGVGLLLCMGPRLDPQSDIRLRSGNPGEEREEGL